MKKFLKIFVTVALLLVALAFIFNEPLKSYCVKYLAQDRLTKLTKDQVRQNNLRSVSYDFKKVKPISSKQVLKASVQNNAPAIGKIAVPSVKLKLPIVKGIDDNALSTGAGTMKPDEKMGKGNYALAGHYMTDKGALLSPIVDVQLDDLIYITDLKSVYTYKVTLKKRIAPDAVWTINDQKGRKLISLITCADGGANRWVIQGNLVRSRVANRATLAVFG